MDPDVRRETLTGATSDFAHETDLFEHDSFYRFITIDDTAALAQSVTEACTENGVLGTVLIASEGINAMLCGAVANMSSIRQWFAGEERFANLFVKTTSCDSQVFGRLKVKVKRELVPLRIEGVDVSKGGGRAVSPLEWRALLDRPDVVVLDNRNSFEFDHGHFRSAIDPGVGRYTNFSDYVEQNRAEWEGKTVAMYCTGGIRCEKTAAWLSQSGMEVLHLEGGIVNFLQQMPDAAEDFIGECFVFDNRTTISGSGIPRTPQSPSRVVRVAGPVPDRNRLI